MRSHLLLPSAVLALALAPPPGGREGLPSEAAAATRERAISSAARWLWDRQGADGSWRSETYGLLRSGQSLTPFVLHALLLVPAAIEPERPEAVERALAWVRSRIDGEGALGRREPLYEDYPNYATALAVRAFARARPPGWKETVAPMVACLLRQQFREDRGWTPEDPAFGGWGMGGPLRFFPHPGHVDLSMTRFVLQALAEAGLERTDAAFARARAFLDRCQRFGEDGDAEGGFFFSPVVEDANKAGREEDGFRPYGSATADGVLALLAAGASAAEARLGAAARWVTRNHRADRVPGFPDSVAERWDEGMRFYYLAASAEAFARLGPENAPPPWAEGLVETLAREQRPDGSFANRCTLGKEDDPLIATTLALLALLHAGPGA